MTKKEMTELFSVMLLAWPNAEMFRGGIAKLGPTVELWAACTADVDFWTGQQAVVRLCKKCKFPPTIAEFREEADGVTREIKGSIDQEWNFIRASRLLDKSLDAWYGSLHPASRVKAVVDIMGGPAALLSADGRMWNYDGFSSAYQKLIRRECALPETRPAIAAGKKGNST